MSKKVERYLEEVESKSEVMDTSRGQVESTWRVMKEVDEMGHLLKTGNDLGSFLRSNHRTSSHRSLEGMS
jgi:hypothetical protein